MITLQVGQCGNQLGESLLDVVHDATIAAAPLDSSVQTSEKYVQNRRARELFFRSDRALDEEEDMLLEESRRTKSNAINRKRRVRKRIARSVLVDMEPRVINECLARKSKWRYDSASCYSMEGGSGNNWAFGFKSHGSKVKDKVLELLRRESETCDYVESFLVLQSVAGGTGSGLGTFLTGALKDSFPDIPRVNCLVWPHSTGEVVVQNYNTLLSMANLQESSSAIVTLFNDQARYICSRLQGIERPELDDLNRVFSRDMASGMLLPSTYYSGTRCGIRSRVRFLCPHPFLKCIQTATYPQMPQGSIEFSSNSWPAIHKQVLHQQDERVELRSMFTLRGRDARGFSKPCVDQLNSVYSSSAKFSLSHSESTRAVHGFDRSISLLTNSRNIVAPLENTITRVHQMFSSGAYIHQYESHGLSSTDMSECILYFEQLLYDYKSITF